MRIHIPLEGNPTILRKDRDCYLKYRIESQGQAAPIDSVVWSDWRIFDFEQPTFDSTTHKQTTDLVENAGVYSFAIVAKTQAELDAELVAERQMMRLSKLEFRMGLNAIGAQKRQEIEDAVAVLDQDAKDAWIFADYFERNHPLIISLAGTVGFTDTQLDNFFRNNVGISAA